MNYVNRLFFDKETGILITAYYKEGNITVKTIEEDLETIEQLKPYSMENLTVKEISKDDTELQDKINAASKISIDLTNDEYIFEMPVPLTEEELKQQRIEQLRAELTILEGVNI